MLLNIFVPIILAVITNVIIFTLKWNSSESNPFLPPGYVIGVIWILIFGCLGYVHYIASLIYGFYSIPALSIIFLITFCLAYPFITKLKQKIGVTLNTVTLILVSIVSFVTVHYIPIVFKWMIPIFLWASYVNIADSLSYKI